LAKNKRNKKALEQENSNIKDHCRGGSCGRYKVFKCSCRKEACYFILLAEEEKENKRIREEIDKA